VLGRGGQLGRERLIQLGLAVSPKLIPLVVGQRALVAEQALEIGVVGLDEPVECHLIGEDDPGLAPALFSANLPLQVGEEVIAPHPGACAAASMRSDRFILPSQTLYWLDWPSLAMTRTVPPVRSFVLWIFNGDTRASMIIPRFRRRQTRSLISRARRARPIAPNMKGRRGRMPF